MSRQESTPVNSDLTALIESPIRSQSEVYSQALQLLSRMRSSPSCNRVVTSKLLTSCQSIDGANSNAEASLEETKSIYSAQLAVCEIVGADSAVPPHCEKVLPLELDSKFDGFDSPRFARSESSRAPTNAKGSFDNSPLSDCLKSLESKPQWWTSYSNNRQNAAVMCRAARVEIEKGESVDFSSPMVV